RPAGRRDRVEHPDLPLPVDSRLRRRLAAGRGRDVVGDVSLQRGIELFNDGHYWEAHEAWEEAWTPDRRGPDSSFYKGLIQVAAGCLHYTRHNRRGTVNKWRSGAGYLRPYPAIHRGVE